MTRSVRVHEFGGPEVLRIEDVETEQPGGGEVRLRIRAIGINRTEITMRSGRSPARPSLPTKIGWEAAGVAPPTASIPWSESVAPEVLVFVVIGRRLLDRIPGARSVVHVRSLPIRLTHTPTSASVLGHQPARHWPRCPGRDSLKERCGNECAHTDSDGHRPTRRARMDAPNI